MTIGMFKMFKGSLAGILTWGFILLNRYYFYVYSVDKGTVL